MKPNKPVKEHLIKALLRKVDRKKLGEKFRPKMLLKTRAIQGPDMFVTPAMYRRLHLGKKKVSPKNGS